MSRNTRHVVDIPLGWDTRRLERMIEPNSTITYGVVQPGPVVEDGIPFIRGGDIYNGRIASDRLRTIGQAISSGYQRTVLKGGEVLMSLVGYPGEVAVVPPTLAGANIARQAALIRLGKEYDPHYVMYFLLSQLGKKRIFEQSNGSAQQVVNLADLKNVAIDIPSPPEQREIARILTTLDDLIEKTETLIAKYQSIKQGMMHDLFTRGVDSHGHLRPTPDQAPDLYKPSELGLIPNEWNCQPLAAVVPRAEYGISESLNDGVQAVPVLRMNNLKGGRVDLGDLKFSASREAGSVQLQHEDVLFNRTNSIEHVGRTSIWLSELPRASFASYLVRLVPDTEQLTPRYLNFWLNLPATQIAIRRYATPGVHQVNINPTQLRRTLIALPTETDEQEAITDRVDQVDSRLESEVTYLSKLKKQKSAMMQDLLTGKVRVKVDNAEEVAVNV